MTTRRLWLIASSAALMLSACADMMGGSSSTKDVVATAQAAPNFSTLAKLVQDAGLTDTLKGPGPFTVFAPTDDAFKQVPQKTLDELSKNKDMLRAVLTYHVVAGKVEAKDVKPGKVKTVNGAEITVQKAGDFVTLNEEAVVTKADIAASNGIIHAIDRVLLPPAPKK